MYKIQIGVAKDGDSKELTDLYRKLYEGDEKKKFYSSKVVPSKVRFGSRIFVARDKKKMIGFCWAIYYEHIKNKGVGVIEELYVDEEYRRKKVGKRLVEAALKFLGKNSIVVFVSTEDEAKDAQQFYDAIGFKICKGPWYVTIPKGG